MQCLSPKLGIHAMELSRTQPRNYSSPLRLFSVYHVSGSALSASLVLLYLVLTISLRQILLLFSFSR